MKERVQRAMMAAITVALGITFVTLIKGEGFSLFKVGLSAFVTFIVDYIFNYLFGVKKK